MAAQLRREGVAEEERGFLKRIIFVLGAEQSFMSRRTWQDGVCFGVGALDEPKSFLGGLVEEGLRAS